MRLRRVCLVVALAAVAAVAAAAAFGGPGAGTITTIAGNGKEGFSGDGGPATKAKLGGPLALAVDAKGNVYIPDNKRVRKVSLGGTITTVPGTVNTGDPLWSPRAVAIDTKGNIYVLAGAGHTDVVYRVSPGGKRTIFAGGGTATKPGYGDGGPATAASTGNLSGLAVDSMGNVYFGDGGISGTGPHVRKVTPEGTISTVAGTAGLASLSLSGMALDRQGNLYIPDYINSQVRKVSRGGTITTFAGTGNPGFSGDGGPATKAMLYLPIDVAVDAKGNVYIADHHNNRVRKVSRSGKITTFAGSGAYRFPPRPLFSGDGGPATKAHLFNPGGVAVDAQGNVYILDSGNHRVRKVRH
jgi:trimeric autotransporter adhesin